MERKLYKFRSPTANECHDPLIQVPSYRLVSRHCEEEKERRVKQNIAEKKKRGLNMEHKR
jgi:hypothetical protein